MAPDNLKKGLQTNEPQNQLLSDKNVKLYVCQIVLHNTRLQYPIPVMPYVTNLFA